ncbi:unnamed protein product [Adineta ricciae]|uniref:Translation elongation factor EF1B beta/delta subunit guanine nucleotide exchange domain-containing protein n=1 Tax=Adineta ricciae TaxID=249248 RepID=A0A815HPE5_ADIRI|nr:unnamed protein product [Adineta ricciae]CAF1412966.1 unnamed protein product [Adineta ricciae]
MNFGDLQSRDGLLSLNKFLVDKSYISGYRPTQEDLTVFEAVKQLPSADFENARRWYKHIASFNDEEKQQFEDVPVTKIDAGTDNDDDFDVFASDDEEESELKRQRLDAYAKQKANKPAEIAKSSIVLDVKPWDDETDMQELEEHVRSVELDGLLWGASQFIPLAYGIRALQITCVVEDEKVGTDMLEEHITAFKDHVQSVDIASFRKI